jgi:hypothetical protein
MATNQVYPHSVFGRFADRDGIAPAGFDVHFVGQPTDIRKGGRLGLA